MKKNVIVLHLESISRSNLWQYRNELGTVWRLMSSALQFNRFFTASTSTVMSVNDLNFGDASARDASPVYQAAKRPSFFNCRILPFDYVERGYRRYYFGSSLYSRKHETIDDNGASINEPNLPVLCEKALAHLAQAKRENTPFYAYFWDDSSHLAYVSPYKNDAPGVPERLQTAYALIDASLNRLLSGLVELGLWENTVIVGFGDHGDEAWSHGLNRGYCHSTPPYGSLTWTPMFIYDPSRFQPAITGKLASMVDIRPTLFGMFFPDEEPLPKTTAYSGVDLFREEREFAFSQNMFALQREYSDPEKGMVKGYAVTDGSYRLVVWSGGNQPRHGGMALYCDQADPANSLNLLKFFKLDRNGDIVKFAPPPDAVAKHFQYVFGEAQVASIEDAFKKLKAALSQFIAVKEEAALREYDLITKTPFAELAEEMFAVRARQGVKDKDRESLARQLAKTKLLLEENAPQRFPMESFTRMAKASS